MLYLSNMKRLSVHIVSLISVMMLLSFQPSNSASYASLYDGLSKGETEKIYTNLSDMVYIQIDNARGSYSKKQAKAVLDKFFKHSKPTKFKLLYDREKKETNLKYSIGNLYTAQGVYKTYLFIKLKENTYYIQQIRFEQK